MGKSQSELLSGLGTASEILKKIVDAVRAQDGTDDDVRAILTNKTLAQDVAKVFVTARSGVKKILSPEVLALLPSKFWTLEEDAPASNFRVEGLKFISFLDTYELTVNGEMMCKRSAKLGGNLGLADVQHIIANQDKLPTALRDRCVVFPRVLIRNPSEVLFVPRLWYGSSGWFLRFSPLGEDSQWGWGGRDVIACCN